MTKLMTIMPFSFVAVLNMLSSFFKKLRGAIGAKRVKCYMRTAKLSVKASSQQEDDANCNIHI